MSSLLASRSASLSMYRALLKSAHKFPSKNRPKIIQEIKQCYRENINEVDTTKLKRFNDEAEAALLELQRFVDFDQSAPIWSYSQSGV